MKWLNLIDYPGYLVSDNGDVASVLVRGQRGRRADTPHILSPEISNEYRVVNLRVDGRQYHKYVGGLVLLAFVGPPEKGDEVHHINWDKLDDRLENLCYLTHDECIELSVKAGRTRSGERHSRSALTNKQAYDIRCEFDNGVPAIDLAARYLVTPATVYRVLRGLSYRDSGGPTVVRTKHLTDIEAELVREACQHMSQAVAARVWGITEAAVSRIVRGITHNG